ncbi:hypothetical protein ACJW31_12G083900 [Castanea mollissima]
MFALLVLSVSLTLPHRYASIMHPIKKYMINCMKESPLLEFSIIQWQKLQFATCSQILSRELTILMQLANAKNLKLLAPRITTYTIHQPISYIQHQI